MALSAITAPRVSKSRRFPEALLRQTSPALAALVARYLIVDERPSQAPYVIPDHLAHADPLIARFEQWARERLAQGFELQAAAAALAVSPRTLQRRCEAVLGKGPLAFVQDLRVQQAAHLLRSTRSLVVAGVVTAAVLYAQSRWAPGGVRATQRITADRGAKTLSFRFRGSARDTRTAFRAASQRAIETRPGGARPPPSWSIDA